MHDFSLNLFMGHLFLGLINGAFYALLSLGLAVIFGMLHVINFAHGMQYMLGAFAAVLLAEYFGIGYWWALLVGPVLVGLTGWVTERVFLRRVENISALYGMLLCLGLAYVVQGTFQAIFGLASLPYSIPSELGGGVSLPFMFVPYYRLWVVFFSAIVCFGTWYVIERTRLGAYLRAATENPEIVRTFGINVPRLVTLTYTASVGLAGLAGVMAAPIYSPQPFMGSDLLVIVFAVVVIGGMGSMLGSILTGFGVGILEGVVHYFYPQGSSTAIFILMVVVLVIRPAGLFGWVVNAPKNSIDNDEIFETSPRVVIWTALAAAIVLAILPTFVYPYVVLQAVCFAIFALSVGFLVTYAGLMSFGHAMFLGTGSYIAAHLALDWKVPSDLSIISGILASAALAYLAGKVALRRQGIYFAMITMGLAQIVYFAALRLPFTRGEDGIQNVPQTKILGFIPLSNPVVMYVTISIVFLLVILGLGRMVNSSFGEALKAIRDNEDRAISLGYRTNQYKLTAFVISGALAGLAGALKATLAQSATLADVHWSTSGNVQLMVLIGGMGTLFGPVVGAFVVFGLMYYFAFLGEWVLVAQGAVFVACVMAFRRGMVGEVIAFVRKRAAKREQQLAKPGEAREVSLSNAR